MKIIVFGDPLKRFKLRRRFECSNCGCIFEANVDEYDQEELEWVFTKEDGTREFVTIPKVSCRCPNCDKVCTQLDDD